MGVLSLDPCPDVTKPAAGGIISSRYLLNVSRYAFENEDLFLFCGTANSFSEDAVVKALEPKIGSLKSLVKATLHDSGSVLERTADGGWKYYYFIHVSLNGWLVFRSVCEFFEYIF